MNDARENLFRRLTFLVVDDNKDTIALVSEMLRGFGVGHVNSANDTSTALAILRSHRIDVVICDWRMKPVDGVRFTQVVRRSPDSRNPFVPIIMLTAYGDETLVVEARDAGVTEFLVKPISPATLLSRIVSVLKAPRDFIETKQFFGPDRRRKEISHHGAERRVEQPRASDAPVHRGADESGASGDAKIEEDDDMAQTQAPAREGPRDDV